VTEDPAQVTAPRGMGGTVWDMVRSIGLIVVIVALTLIFVPGLVHPSKSDKFPAIDYSSYVSGFRDVTGKPALTPVPVPSGWRATSGRLSGPAAAEHLHIGFAAAGSAYAGLEESVAPMSRFVTTVLGRRGATVTGTTQIAGADWQSRLSSRGELALSRRVAGVSVIVTGSAAGEQLELLAGSLH
jgi:hypothetical protein